MEPKELYKLKAIIHDLEKKPSKEEEQRLLQQLIEAAQQIKDRGLLETQGLRLNPSIKIEKISEETFMYKPIQVRNYYEGDYLERFGQARTSDLKSCQLLNMHNRFWQAHEVQKGNVFASIPEALMDPRQRKNLANHGWLSVKVDVYQVLQWDGRKKSLAAFAEQQFPHYVIVRETYGDIPMILHYHMDF